MSEDVRKAYEAGHVTFMGLRLAVAPGALVPRAETELLAGCAIDALRAMELTAPRVIDVCCGVGNIACAVAANIPASRVWAVDISPACTALAEQNTAACDVADRVSVHEGDLFGALDGLGLDGTVDLIVCNPPYISEKALGGERAALLDHEPRTAFAAGPYGLTFHSRVAREGAAFLRGGGVLLFEVGAGQDRQVSVVLERARAYGDVRCFSDGAGRNRVVSAQKKAAP